jgi:hypothetical protein
MHEQHPALGGHQLSFDAIEGRRARRIRWLQSLLSRGAASAWRTTFQSAPARPSSCMA